jgi:hypothetical protein
MDDEEDPPKDSETGKHSSDSEDSSSKANAEAASRFNKSAASRSSQSISEDSDLSRIKAEYKSGMEELEYAAFQARFEIVEGKISQQSDSLYDDDWPFSAFVATEGDPAQVALLVAIGVLAGLGATQIMDASGELAKRFRLREPAAPPPEGKFRLDMSQPRDSLLKLIDAEALPPADGQAERLAFRSGREAARVVRCALDQFGPEIRRDVMDWLVMLGDVADDRTRSAAGASIGEIWRQDFEAERNPIFESWRTAPSERPLAALDAALAVLDRTGGEKAATAAVDQMIRRADFDDVFALGRLASGTYGAANPGAAFRILASLLRMHRTDAFGLALHGYFWWLARGRHDKEHTGRVFVELDRNNSKHPLDMVQKAWLVSAMVARATRGDKYSVELFKANMKQPEARAAFGRLLNFSLFFPDHKIKAPPVRAEARATARLLFRRGMADKAVRQVSVPLINAALHEVSPEHAERLRQLVGAWTGAGPIAKFDEGGDD